MGDVQNYRCGELTEEKLIERLSEKCIPVEVEIVQVSLRKVFYFVNGDLRTATMEELLRTIERCKDKDSAIKDALRVIKEATKEEDGK